jgi:hypothetical protein
VLIVTHLTNHLRHRSRMPSRRTTPSRIARRRPFHGRMTMRALSVHPYSRNHRIKRNRSRQIRSRWRRIRSLMHLQMRINLTLARESKLPVVELKDGTIFRIDSFRMVKWKRARHPSKSRFRPTRVITILWPTWVAQTISVSYHL